MQRPLGGASAQRHAQDLVVAVAGVPAAVAVALASHSEPSGATVTARSRPYSPVKKSRDRPAREPVTGTCHSRAPRRPAT